MGYKEKKIKKNNKAYIKVMIDRVVECRTNDIKLKLPVIGNVPKNIATVARPNKDETIKAHMSKFAIGSP